jgi:hypothetical protein
MVQNLFFFANKNALDFKKKFFFLAEIMICSRKSKIFDTFSVLNQNPNKKNRGKSIGKNYCFVTLIKMMLTKSEIKPVLNRFKQEKF